MPTLESVTEEVYAEDCYSYRPGNDILDVFRPPPKRLARALTDDEKLEKYSEAFSI